MLQILTTAISSCCRRLMVACADQQLSNCKESSQ